MVFETWRMLRPFLPGATPRTVLVVVLSLVGGVAESIALLLAVQLVTGPTTAVGSGTIVEDWLSSAQTKFVVALAAGLVSLATHVLVARLAGTLSASVLRNTRSEAIRAFVRSDWPTQSSQREGAFQELVSNLCFRVSTLTQSLVSVVTNVILSLTFLISAALVDWLATLTVVALGAGVALAIRWVSRATRRSGRAFTRANATFSEEISRVGNAAMELKVFGVQAAFERGLLDQSSRVAHMQSRVRFFAMLAPSLFKDVAVLLLIVCLGVIALTVGSGSTAIIAVLALVVRALSTVQAISASAQAVNEISPSLSLLHERLATLTEGRDEFGGRDAGAFGALKLRGVSYAYDEAAGIHDIDLSIREGESIGIIGKSGAGKSTLLQVLLRLRRPTRGSVTLGGEDYLELSESSWASIVGFVPQEPSLLEASVAENIDFGRGLPRSVIETAARRAHVFEEIESLPSGFDTMLGPRGSGLSGGQKQRVAIARALAGDPRLLVMDEPTSALDPRSEELLTETLADLHGRTTLVLVAHRMTTVRTCDRLVVMGDGRIIDEGVPQELLDGAGEYKP